MPIDDVDDDPAVGSNLTPGPFAHVGGESSATFPVQLNA